jgi:hypothetical protein
MLLLILLMSLVKKYEEKIKKFSDQDVNHYQAWFKSTFSKLLEDIDNLNLKYNELIRELKN